ncbi:MAG TPA: M14 family zinc carboxypeptidase [Chthonomonadaceae bacterium]|nr:M14 family zinc carboxypeptidase [Chthonomonadaceae bacterium]
MAVEYIQSGFENGSPLDWEVRADGRVHVRLQYDHERGSPNRAAGHWHFRLEGAPGSTVDLALEGFDNVWNGVLSSPISDRTSCFLSAEGRAWSAVPASKTADNRLELTVQMPGPELYVARLEPYRLSDLDRLLEEIQADRRVEIQPIGASPEGRPLEIVRVGREAAPHRALVRARSHPWEPGGNWVVQGLIRSLLADEATSRAFLERCALYVLPMADKDGVVRGRTRFNTNGMDLNRSWERPADPALAPENAAVERWLEALIGRGLAPQLAIDLHNDNSGKLHVSRPDIPGDPHVAKMLRLEALLREHTWFREGSKFSTPGQPWTVGVGLLERYGIDACILELNCDWIAGLGRVPFGADWELFGHQLRGALLGYFGRA